MLKAQGALASVRERIQMLFGYTDFSPEEALAASPNIDPRFIAQAPMSNANIDVHVLGQLGSIGLKRGKEITATSHPELYHAWATMSARAGLTPPPQLILAESKTINALTLSPQEVAVTTGLLKLLNLREVAAVLGHELGHGSSNHTTPRVAASAIFGGAGLVLGDHFAYYGGLGQHLKADVANPSFLRRAALGLFGNGKAPLSFLGSAASVTAGGALGMMVANQVSVRPTELDADRKGALISGDPEGLISALSKLDRNRKSSPIRNFFSYLQSGYPSMETRIRRLRELEQHMPAESPAAPMEAVAPVPVAQAEAAMVMPTTEIRNAVQAERVGTPVAPALANV
ncbi:MAG: M48 family metalloprotease [Alphaproteobacteria bacterium]|nr:M48 family metalloprotease [Alphaproteobacteria bacterium]